MKQKHRLQRWWEHELAQVDPRVIAEQRAAARDYEKARVIVTGRPAPAAKATEERESVRFRERLRAARRKYKHISDEALELLGVRRAAP